MGLLAWLGVGGASETDVRAEVWRLGARHNGRPLEGALEELNEPGLSAERAQLLRACVRKLRTA